jgi:glycosyltransferase involved in cell wall biosynthesis
MDENGYGLSSIAGELRLLLCQARRRGYRNLVLNRVVISSSLSRARIYPSVPMADMCRIREMYADVVRADAWSANLPQHRLEIVLAGAYANDSKEHRSLLLDCRGMQDTHNGTSRNILGLLDGFQELDTSWRIDVLAQSVPAEFHKLRKRYPKLRLLLDHPESSYTVSVLLNQPWALSTIDELHRHSLLIAFNMLDTISWDILYESAESLDSLWRFVARFSDLLFYNSQFTRDRFTTRFPLCPGVAECVTYLSMSADELVNPSAQGPVGDNILIFGNDYDHKDVRRTLRVLVDAFPFNKVAAIGIKDVAAPNAMAMLSGQIDEAVLHRLMATARVIVFPSFYEGFGMPVVEGLAYGRTVLVRQSSLWNEIASQLRLPGQLATFDSATALVEVVGRTLAGLPLNALPQGTALRATDSPLRWRDCAQRMIRLAEQRLSVADGTRWQEREEALSAIRLLRP